MSTSSFLDVYKIDKSYFWQVVNYFLVIDTLEELDFMLFNPDFYDRENMIYIINVTRKELKEYITKADEQLKIFRTHWLKLEKDLKLKNRK